jgi:ADP-heptose:LPS heptosyltransferase
MARPQATILEYVPSGLLFLSKGLDEWARRISAEAFDVCVVLERRPKAPLLYLAGRSSAPVRAGYGGSGEAPFYNLHINPSAERKYLSDWNFAMAQMFGAINLPQVHFDISIGALDDISCKMPQGAGAQIGIDAGFFLRKFGAAWTRELCRRISENRSFSCSILCEGEGEKRLDGIGSFSLFPNLGPAHLGALLSKSDCLVSGGALSFKLAQLMGRPVIGVFETSAAQRYCHGSANARGLAYCARPDGSTIEKIVQMVNDITDMAPPASAG